MSYRNMFFPRSGCRKALAICVLTLVSTVTIAASPFSTDGIAISVPDGFEGPIVQNQGPVKVIAFAKQHTASVKTLLQISIFDPGPNAIPATLSQKELSDGAQKYVLDFVKGVERRRTEYSQGAVSNLSIAGIPAAKVAWNGNLDGLKTNGVMYCVILKGKVFQFHTQDLGSEATANMREAMKAIEAVGAK